MELHTIVDNQPAIALYLASGWTMTDRLVHNDGCGITYDEHVLVNRLRPADRHRLRPEEPTVRPPGPPRITRPRVG